MVAPAPGSRLLSILEELTEKDFKSFKDRLNNSPDGEKSIPWGKLEKADFIDTKNLLVQHYTLEKAVRVTGRVLEDINMRQLAQRLRDLFPVVFHQSQQPLQDSGSRFS